jgi:tetratricopeptide (TPR) repeat protein
MRGNRCVLNIIIMLTINTAMFSQPKGIKEIMTEADANFEVGDYINALLYYKQVLATEKNNDKAVLNSVISMLNLGMAYDSVRQYEPQLAASEIPDAKYYLAVIYHRQKKFNEATALLMKYAKENKNSRTFGEQEVSYMMGVCRNAKSMMASPRRSIIKNTRIMFPLCCPMNRPFILHRAGKAAPEVKKTPTVIILKTFT